jgi:hypothetical protein
VTAAELLGHDYPGMQTPSSLLRLVQRCEIADVIGEDGSVFSCSKRQLFLVGSGVFSGFFRPQDIVTAAAQIDGQSSHDVPVEVQTGEESFKAG